MLQRYFDAFVLPDLLKAPADKLAATNLHVPANEILVGDVLTALGGKLYESSFCDLHAGIENICTHSIDCSIRSLWKTIQTMLDGVIK